MDRSARTQNPYTPYDWMNTAAPSRCEVCGRTLAPTGQASSATDWASQANQWYTSTYGPMMDNWNRMWSSMAQPWAGMAQAWMPPGTSPAWPGQPAQPQTQPQTQPHHQHQHHHHHHGQPHDCGCDQGDCDDCRGGQGHCRCCIADADLVVYARLGERRVVPLTIENPRRRERAVKLELSAFTRSGRAAENVKAQITGPAEFTIQPCREHEAILLIEAMAPTSTDTQANERSADVEDCEIFYADLRVEGCDMRPVRIALALLPRDCAGYKLDCGCSCC